MKKRLRPHLVILSFTALLATVAAADVASAFPKGGTDPDPPSDPEIVPGSPKPPKPPNTCAAPEVKDCQDLTYLASACGAANKAACGDLIAPRFQAEVRSIPETTQVLKTAGNTAKLQLAKKLPPVAMPARKYGFGSLSFATASQIGRTPTVYADNATLTPQHPAYETNGQRVASCQEYAYETLYDQERFAEAAETCGTNAECVYQLSLRTDTPALKATMLKKNGQPMTTQRVRPGAFSITKNVFFGPDADVLRQSPSYASSPTYRAKAEAIIAHVSGTARVTAPSELAWHHTMHDAFVAAPLSAAELANIEERLTRYHRAQADYRQGKAFVTIYDVMLQNMTGSDLAQGLARRAGYQAQLERARANMAAFLVAEWDHLSSTDGVTSDRGCLSRTTVKCDWSPKQFVEQYAVHFSQQSESLFSACIDATAGDFSRVPAAYAANTDTLASWIAARSLPKLGTQIVGQRTSDGDEWGDRAWFAAGYGYDAGWSIAAERQTGTNRICKLKGGAYASGYASAYAFDNTIPVLDTQHKLSVRENGDAITFHSHLRVVGQDVYTPIDKSFSLPSATPIDEHVTNTLAQRTYVKWFTIAGVGVKVQARTELRAGADLTAHATAATGCNPENLAYDAALTVRPWIDVHVVPEVSVGIGIIQAGVRGDVDLVKVATPASGSVKLVGGVNDITLQLRADAGVTIDALSGKIDVFLESCFPYLGCSDLASKQIYSWDGYHFDIPVFAFAKDVRFDVFEAATLPSGSGSGGGPGVFLASLP